MSETATAVTRNVKRILAEKDRSQGWLARRMGESPSWVSRRLTRKIVWNTDDIDRVAEALSVSAFSLILGERAPQAASLKDAA